MDRSDPTIPEQVKTLIPVLEARHNDLRKKMVDLGSGNRTWAVDIELAVQDLKAVLEVMSPERPDNDE